MRVAVLSDIHGNLPALEAVLAEPDVATADRVVLLGDIALGPLPAESLDLLDSLGERAVWVHGNCEREVITAYDGKSLPGPNADGARADRGAVGGTPPGPARRAAAHGVPRRGRSRRDAVLPCDAATRRRDGAGRQPGRRVATGAGGRVGRAGRRRSHAHAVRPTGRRAARGEPGQRRACRTAPWARAGHCSARQFNCAARRTTARLLPRGSGPGAIRMRRRGRQSTSWRHRAMSRRWRSSASWSIRSSEALASSAGNARIPCG